MDTATQQWRFHVGGMDCAACARKIDTAVRRLPGVQDVSVSVAAGTMTLTGLAGVDLDALQHRVHSLGYTTTPLPAAGRRGETAMAPDATPPACGNTHHDHNHDHRHGSDRDRQHAGHASPAAAPGAMAFSPAQATAGARGWRAWPQGGQARLTLACGAGVVLAFVLAQAYPPGSVWAYLAAMAIGLVPIARRAIAAARNGSPFTIEMLMSVAAAGAVVIGATEEAAVVVLLFLIGERLEGLAAGRARASIAGLAALIPRTGLREDGAELRSVPAAELRIDDIVRVRPGDRIPADAQVLSGASAVDEAPVTGESTPRSKAPGDAVYAGTINGDGVLRLRVTAAAADNTIARIIALVEQAQEAKAPTERLIDRFSRWYTPAVIVVAALVAVLPPLLGMGDWSTWVYRGLAILLIGCPCALVISTPAAIAAALSAGARRGLLMKGGAVLEALRGIDIVAFDKTGTLTEGRPQVTDIVAGAWDEAHVLRLAAGLERGASHPLARAVLARAEAEGVSLPDAAESTAQGGRGVAGRIEGMTVFLGSPAAAAGQANLPAALHERIARLQAEGKTVAVLVVDGMAAGALAMRDEPRADARAGLAALQRQGVTAVMLTGDNRQTADAVGAVLGIAAHAELLPQDKQRIVNELRAQGRRVAKVGDGINDAPALAAADVGIAMGGGADVALETADAAILHGRVLDVADMLALSRAAVRNIGQNIGIALGLKAVLLVTTVLGITGLWPAILADTGATVLVTANALRLLAWRGSTQA
ncbi:cadmium-translocating P-type ATPase [Verticiella sediminum]|uniref:P-type Zn(2+) transporter n=1 Tax=Verticiella sediminum TaxID=1247510 RepID=A0A556AIN4_9BURK|nr:heavy metal translocating P-type ATPase [Verticiella sediminum]TSH92730.1 cadmium-translocating P-type ATPase [Verticiella sediminum]